MCIAALTRRLRTASLIALLPLTACDALRHSERPAGPDQPPPTVRVDPSANGAAPSRGPPVAGIEFAGRRLAYVIRGVGRADDHVADPDRRPSMSQAAVVEALCGAVAEARRLRGESGADLTVPLSPRLTITTKSAGPETHEVELTLVVNGRSNVFRARGGVLQHPPNDLSIVRRVFEETHGDYALISTEFDLDGNQCVAVVGAYRPADLATAAPPAAMPTTQVAPP